MDCLLLNADGQPVTFLPLSAITWQESVSLLWQDKVVVLDWYDDWTVHSEKWQTQVPAVVMLREQRKRVLYPKFSKNNIFLRDLNTCAYCKTVFHRSDLTLDHVIPQSKGGKTNWTNIVAACGPCNRKKGNQMITPDFKPWQPTYFELVRRRQQLKFDIRHPSWRTYLFG